jgi:hypothetical protein
MFREMMILSLYILYINYKSNNNKWHLQEQEPEQDLSRALVKLEAQPTAVEDVPEDDGIVSLYFILFTNQILINGTYRSRSRRLTSGGH